MKKIYIVAAEWNYEGSSNIRAFASKARADAFRDKCAAHHAKRTWYDGDFEDVSYEKWSAKNEKWEKSHPAGEDATTADSFGSYAVNFDHKDAP